MKQNDVAPKIVYIAGAGRSGSTILEKIMGEIEGITALGEVVHLWERGFKNNQLCGCGVAFRDCEVWNDITRIAYPDDSAPDIELILQAVSSVERLRHLPLHLTNLLHPNFRARVAFLARHTYTIYNAAASVFGADVIIDSSKHMHGHVLMAIPDANVYVVHLVRDGRATSFSWSRAKVYERRSMTAIEMPRIHPYVAATHWLLDNLSAELLRLRSEHYMRIRYEDLVADPRKGIERILKFIEFPTSSIPVSDDSRVVFGVQHTVSGNPVRFGTGETTIRADEEWRTHMPRAKQGVVASLTWPLLLRYGYFRKKA